MTTVDQLKEEAETEALERQDALYSEKVCAICKIPLGTMNDDDGEKWLRQHYARDHPGMKIRTEVIK